MRSSGYTQISANVFLARPGRGFMWTSRPMIGLGCRLFSDPPICSCGADNSFPDDRLVRKNFFARKGVPSLWGSSFPRVDEDSSETRGGAIFCAGVKSLIVQECMFVANSASKDGGALCAIGGETLKVSRSVFIGNRAKWGGALFVANFAKVEVSDCVFIANTAGALGAALSAVRCGQVCVSRCITLWNVAKRAVGDFEFDKCDSCLVR